MLVGGILKDSLCTSERGLSGVISGGTQRDKWGVQELLHVGKGGKLDDVVRSYPPTAEHQ